MFQQIYLNEKGKIVLSVGGTDSRHVAMGEQDKMDFFEGFGELGDYTGHRAGELHIVRVDPVAATTATFKI